MVVRSVNRQTVPSGAISLTMKSVYLEIYQKETVIFVSNLFLISACNFLWGKTNFNIPTSSSLEDIMEEVNDRNNEVSSDFKKLIFLHRTGAKRNLNRRRRRIFLSGTQQNGVLLGPSVSQQVLSKEFTEETPTKISSIGLLFLGGRFSQSRV